MGNFGIQRLHLLGIGGAGMSSLAVHLVQEGHAVSGSDLRSSGVTDELQARGVAFQVGRDTQLPPSVDRVIRSSAISDDDPEVVEARRRGLPVVHRSIELSRLFNQAHGIAIAGSHGKTTTSALLTHVLLCCDRQPSAMVGGNLVGYDTNAFVGSSPYFIIEADESDGSLMAYVPEHTVVTSVDADVNVTASAYANCGYNRGKVQAMVNRVFRRFSQQTRQGLWVCHDHARAHALLGHLPKARLYGTDGTCQLRAQALGRGRFHTLSRIYYHGERLGQLRVPMPGHHNVLNALAVVGIALDLGIAFPEIAHAVAMFRGVHRRFENVGTKNGCLCIDDYAHNPQKVAAALRAGIQACRGRLVALFQPHRYTRMKLLGDAFLPALDGADQIVLTDVYTSGEEPNGFDIEQFHEALVKRSPEGSVHWAPEEQDVHRVLDEIGRPGDTIVSLGAGSCGQWLRDWVEQ